MLREKRKIVSKPPTQILTVKTFNMEMSTYSESQVSPTKTALQPINKDISYWYTQIIIQNTFL